MGVDGRGARCDRSRGLVVSRVRARRLLALQRARRLAAGELGATGALAARRRGRAGAQRSRRIGDSIGSLLAAGLSRAMDRHSGRRREQRRHRRRGAPSRRRRGDRAAARRDRPRLAGRMDRQALGHQAGHRARERAAAARRTICCSPMPTSCIPRFACAGWSRTRHAKRARADFADGEAALRQPCRARRYSRLRLLLPDALSVRLGERSAQPDRGRRRRLHAGARRRACQSRRHRGHPRRADRRLRLGEGAQSVRARSGSA